MAAPERLTGAEEWATFLLRKPWDHRRGFSPKRTAGPGKGPPGSCRGGAEISRGTEKPPGCTGYILYRIEKFCGQTTRHGKKVPAAGTLRTVAGERAGRSCGSRRLRGDDRGGFPPDRPRFAGRGHGLSVSEEDGAAEPAGGQRSVRGGERTEVDRPERSTYFRAVVGKNLAGSIQNPQKWRGFAGFFADFAC